MIKVHREAGWHHKHLLAKNAAFDSVKRDLELFIEDKKQLESLGYRDISLSFIRGPGDISRGQVVISLTGGNNLLHDLHHDCMLIDYDKYIYTLQSIFHPEDEVEEVAG